MGSGHESGGLYILNTPSDDVSHPIACTSRVALSLHQLHCHFGHPSHPTLKKLCPSLKSMSSIDYESCQLAKYCRTSYFPKENKQVASLFDIVNSDI